MGLSVAASTTLTPAERTLRAQIASNTSWANTIDRRARTAAARRAAEERFEREVDPDSPVMIQRPSASSLVKQFVDPAARRLAAVPADRPPHRGQHPQFGVDGVAVAGAGSVKPTDRVVDYSR
jgi:hypothetical protein